MEPKPVEISSNDKTPSKYKKILKIFLYISIPLFVFVIVISLVLSSFSFLNPNEVDFFHSDGTSL